MLINKKTYKIVAIITLCMCNTLHCVVEPGSKQDTGATAIKSATHDKPSIKKRQCPPSPPRLRPSKEPPLTDGQKLDDEPEFKLPPAEAGDYDAFELLHPAEADNALKIFNTEIANKDKDGLQNPSQEVFSTQLSAPHKKQQQILVTE